MKLTKLVIPAIVALCLAFGSAWAADKVNINTATQEELQLITGIGPSTAAAIVEYRQQAGPFSSVEQLTDVKGIGAKKLERIESQVTISE